MKITKPFRSLHRSPSARIARSFQRPLLVFLVLVTIFGLAITTMTACSFRTPSTETPAPSGNAGPQKIEKSFFVNPVTENTVVKPAQYDAKGRLIQAPQYEQRTVLRPKTFLCGWVSLDEVGWISKLVNINGVQMTGHCNIEFEITAENLIGRLINPSFPDNRNRWRQVIAIPITKHYYYERAKDSYGRDTNEFIENTTRSDWSARPFMELNFSGLKILDGNLALFWDSRTGATTGVDDLEWDQTRGFLGFTLTASSAEFGADHQGRFRFNFLRFEHNPSFEPTPYASSNARFLNALHILGEKVNGISPILYTARWDLAKTHDVYLHGFPKSYVPIAQAVVNAWNDVFEKTEAHGVPNLGLGLKTRPFTLKTEPLKHGFDLRYPSITWVADTEISMRSPLGVGMALADVKNGEILWGGITLYGGMLEAYIKAFLPTGGAAEGSAGSALKTADRAVRIAALGDGFFTPPQKFLSPENFLSLGVSTSALRATLAKRISAGPTTATPTSPTATNTATAATTATTAASDENPSRDQQREQDVETATQSLMTVLAEVQNQVKAKTEEHFSRTSLAQLFDLKGLQFDENGAASGKTGEPHDLVFGGRYHSMSAKERENALLAFARDGALDAQGGVVHDTDRRFIDVAPGWAMVAQKNGQRNGRGGHIDFDSTLQSVVRELIMHEYGHFLGLGHQFKENILPEKDLTPPQLYAALEARAKANDTNSTSVMGYRSPITEIEDEAEHILPGPQDALVLRYLYKREFPGYKRGSGASAFTFFPVPKNGVIPPEREGHQTAYFPQCNDFHASTSADPYCNRFDRGHNAESIVKSYLEGLNGNLISRIYSFADTRGGDSEMAEQALWLRALSDMGRIRLFYDHMRQKFAEEIAEIASDTRDLYEFSRVCTGELPGSAKLQGIFSRKPELKELCRVNRMAVIELAKFLVNPGPDRTRMDYDNEFNPTSLVGGDAELDHSRAFGTRTALSVLPLKLSALNALTTPRPYFFWGPWLVPVPRYSDEQGSFSYSSLYPLEFTQGMAASVEKNLKFASIDPATGRPAQTAMMGRSVLSMGYFLGQQQGSNDASRFPREYIETIRGQTDFRLSLTAVLLNMKTREDNTRVTHFDMEIFDFRTGKPIKGGEAFLLPGGKVIVRGPSRTFIYPVTKFLFLNDTAGVVLAYKVDYDDKHDDLLAAYSVKASFEKLHTSVIDACLRGQNNGLKSFFNSQEDPKNFPGFEVLPGITADKEKQIRFLDSIQENFDLYYAAKKGTTSPPTPEICEESLRGLGLIVSSAAVLNGYWLPEVWDYLVK